jgi:O-antigen/teichoic acid export membrane protein
MKLKQKSLLSFVFNIANSLLGFISVFFISRFMGPEAMGALSSSMAFAGLFAIFGDFGFGIAHYKKVSEGQDLGKCIGTFLVIRISTTLIMGLATIIAFYGSYFFTGKFPIESKYMNIFYIVFISGLFANLLTVISFTFAARIEKVKEWSSLFTQKFVNSALKVVVAVSGLGIIYLAWSNVVAVVMGALVSIYLFRKYPIGRFDKALFRSYLLYALPAIMIGVTETVSMNIDKVFISYFSGIKSVGYYTSSQSLISILSYVGAIFVSLLLPTYSAMHAQGKMDDIRKLANRVERYISMLLMPLVFFVFFFADPIRMIILGSKFANSTPIISILVINAMLVIFNQPYSSQLLGTNQIRLGMLLGMFMLSLNIVSNLILIPDHFLGLRMFGLGPKGAAISLLFSSFVGTLLFRYFAFKTSQSKPNYLVFYHLLIAVFSFGSMYMIHRWLALSIYFIPAYFIAGVLVFLSLMILFKLFTKEDVKYYLNMLSPRLMKNYVKEELNN